MKKLDVSQMEVLQGGTNRQCLIDGVLTIVGTGLGAATGGGFGAAVAFVGGLFAANSNGCFNK